MQNNNKPKIHISISKEHEKNVIDIQEIFNDFDAEVDANLVRLSAEDLPTQIMIFLGGAVVSGLTWDLIKTAIKKIYQKFSKASVTIRDKDSIMYTIKNDFTVVVVVVPDRKKEFEHIKNFEDLTKHIAIKNNK